MAYGIGKRGRETYPEAARGGGSPSGVLGFATCYAQQNADLPDTEGQFLPVPDIDGNPATVVTYTEWDDGDILDGECTLQFSGVSNAILAPQVSLDNGVTWKLIYADILLNWELVWGIADGSEQQARVRFQVALPSAPMVRMTYAGAPVHLVNPSSNGLFTKRLAASSQVGPLTSRLGPLF